MRKKQNKKKNKRQFVTSQDQLILSLKKAQKKTLKQKVTMRQNMNMNSEIESIKLEHEL